jgi:hypothetical protein
VSSQLRGQRTSTAVILALTVLVEIFCLTHGTLGVVLIIALVVLAIIGIVLRMSLERAAMWSAYLAAFTLCWNGWYVGPARPGDVLVLISLMLFVATMGRSEFPRIPVWIVQLAVVIALLAVIHILFPDSANYLNSRTVLGGNGQPTTSTRTTSLALTNIGVAFKFIVGVAAIPVMFGFAALRDRRSISKLAIAFAVGSAVSGWVAILEKLGFPTLDRLLLHIAVPGAPRQLGLSYHPNFLAAGLVIAVPIGVWLLVERQRIAKWYGWFTVLGCLLGTYASGSRGGTVTIVFAVGVSFLLIPRTRRFVLPAIGVALTAALATYVAFPAFGHKILVATRLIGGAATTQGSNLARDLLAQQGWEDFHHSPFVGVGLQVSSEAQNVYVQALASGGLLLMTGLGFYLLFAAITSWSLIPRSPLAAALCASVLSAAVLDIFEADLTDRFYYVPIAAIVGLGILMRDPMLTHEDIDLGPPSPNTSQDRTPQIAAAR